MNPEKLAHAVQIIKAAGLVSLRYFNQLQTLDIQEKKTLDFVSEADLAVERYITEEFKKAFPNDGFIGEESFHEKGQSHYAQTVKTDDVEGYWVVDPIDGTANFINHLNYWCISVAYYDCKEKKATMGIIYQPCLDKMFVGGSSHGVSLNGIRLPSIAKPLSTMARKQSLLGLGTGTSVPIDLELKILTFIKKLPVGYRKQSCCALMLTEVVVGSYRAYFEPRINSWDCLAGLMMIEELGGKTCDFLANNGLISGNVLLAGTPEFYPLIEPLIKISSEHTRTP